MSDIQSNMSQNERDKIRVAKQAATEESFDGRKAASSWEEFKEFEAEVKFKIDVEVKNISRRGEEGIRQIDKSLGALTEEIKEIRRNEEIKIQEVKIKGMKLGSDAQKIVDKLSEQTCEKIKDEGYLKGVQEKEFEIQQEIKIQIEKIESMYKEFLRNIEEIRKRMDELLLNLETKIKEIEIKEIKRKIIKP
jgi:hypothetical protein